MVDVLAYSVITMTIRVKTKTHYYKGKWMHSFLAFCSLSKLFEVTKMSVKVGYGLFSLKHFLVFEEVDFCVM